MPNALTVIENAIKKGASVRLAQMVQHLGVDINIYRRTIDDYDEVYGLQAGIPDKSDSSTLITTIKALIAGDDFGVEDARTGGILQQGFMYTDYIDFKEDDLVSIKRQDGKIREYKIERKESVGWSTAVVERYRLSALID